MIEQIMLIAIAEGMALDRIAMIFGMERRFGEYDHCFRDRITNSIKDLNERQEKMFKKSIGKIEN